MSKKTTLLTGLILCLIPLVYLYLIYDSISVQIPMHYNWKGEVDRIGSKQELFGMVGLLSGLNLLILLLFTNIQKINPQRSKVFSATTFYYFGLVVSLFLCLLQIFFIHKAQNPGPNSVKVLLTICSVFFMLLGNFMHSLKHNYFAGIRTPWTLADENNWNATHRLGGKIWFWGGLASSILCMLAPLQYVTIIFIIITIGITLIPIVYSFIYFKQRNQS